MPEKNIRRSKSALLHRIITDGALTLLLLALPPAPIKSLILSASEKFFMDISCMACTLCWRIEWAKIRDRARISWQPGNRETYVAFGIRTVFGSRSIFWIYPRSFASLSIGCSIYRAVDCSHIEFTMKIWETFMSAYRKKYGMSSLVRT